MSVNVYNKENDELKLVAGGTLYADAPIGAISPFGGSVIPSGYLLCNGQAVNRTTYAELFAVIGTAFGTGDGSTTFNVPDLREATTIGVNYIIKAKHASVPTNFSDSLIGYLGQESNYNLYPWSHERTVESADDNQNVIIERDGWYSIDYTLTSNTDALHTFTFRDFDSLGEVHTIMRCHYDKSGTFRQTFLVPLKAGTYRYSHGGIGTLSVYMNRRDFA